MFYKACFELDFKKGLGSFKLIFSSCNKCIILFTMLVRACGRPLQVSFYFKRMFYLLLLDSQGLGLDRLVSTCKLLRPEIRIFMS